MYFYDAQGFYNKSKCIEGFMNRFNFSNPSPPSSEPPAQQQRQQTGLLGVNTSVQNTPPPSQQQRPQTGLLGVNTSISPPPEEQPAQPPAQQPVQQTDLFGVKTSISPPPEEQPAQPPAQQPVQQTDLFGVKTSISPPPEEQPAQPPAQRSGFFGQPAQSPAQQTASQETSTTSSTTSQEQTISSQSQIPLINLNPPIQQASNQNLNNSILNGYVTNLVSSKFNELNKSNENRNRIVNIKIFTLKDPEVFIINDETKANSYNQESSKIFRVFYKPKLEKSQILIEISSYYDISGTHKDKFECEINVSEDKNHYTDSKGGKRIAIRKIRFEKQIGGGARTGSFFPSGIFKNNNTKPKYFHFNVKREGSDDRFKLARGKNSKFLEVEGLIKIIEIKD